MTMSQLCSRCETVEMKEVDIAELEYKPEERVEFRQTAPPRAFVCPQCDFRVIRCFGEYTGVIAKDGVELLID